MNVRPVRMQEQYFQENVNWKVVTIYVALYVWLMACVRNVCKLIYDIQRVLHSTHVNKTSEYMGSESVLFMRTLSNGGIRKESPLEIIE